MNRVLKSIVSLFVCACIIVSLSVTAFAQPKEKAEEKEYPVDIKAKSAILMDCTTGKVLMAYNEHEKRPPASVTKIMPMLIFTEAVADGTIALSDIVTVSSEARKKGGSQIWLEDGEQMTVDDLFKAVAVASANDACTALGEYIAGSETAFIQLMNNRAKELGMNDTTFVNCSGLDDTDTNYTSAYDIALMSAEIMKHKEIVTRYTTIWMDSLRDGKTELVNTNKLVRFYNGATGLKTGTTSKAGCCLSATALRDGLHLVAVVMGSDNSSDRFETAKALLNWGFSNYSMVTPKIDNKLITEVAVKKGESDSVKPVLPSLTPMLVRKGEESKIKQTITLAISVNAPVEKGQSLGKAEFTLDGKVLGSYNIVSPVFVDELRLGVAFRRLLARLT